jgi:hypothetical protein
MGSSNRRRHRTFVTHNTEYHLRDEECVGVRDRASGRWYREHAALRLHALRLPPRGSDQAWIGQRIQFWGTNADVLTSAVVAVGRPPREALEGYISRATAGEIGA